MRILILANYAGGLYGFRGELLESLVDEGHEVFFVVPELSKDMGVKTIEQLGCRYIYIPMNRRGINPIEDLRLINNYQKCMEEIKPNIVLSYTIKPNIYGSYVASRMGIPMIMNITGMGSSFNGNLALIIKTLYKNACNRATTIFFQNQSNLDYFLNNKMVPENKVRLIPGSGVNLDKFQPRDKANREDEIVRFLFIGRIMRDKGIGEYLKMAEIITKSYPNTEFQILGSYEEKQYMELVEFNSQIKYLGRSDDVREQIREIDCIINPSYHEGMSNVLLEGGAMAKPLLASDIPGCKEIVDHGINGYLFEPRSVDSLVEKVQQFLTLDSKQRQSMGEASRRKVEKEFDRNLVIEAYMKAIQEIMDRK